MTIHLMSPEATAKALCISPKTLEAMRLRGNGPQWVKVSARRVAYRPDDIEIYIDKRTYSSTSEYGRAG